MIERGGPLSLSRQCKLVGVSRSSQYYRPKGERAENLALMRRLDELHMAYPFYGSRQPAADAASAPRGRHRGPAPDPAAHAPDGDGGDLPAAAHERGESGAPGLPVPAARPDDLTGGPCVVRGHHLYLDNIFIERLWRSLKYEAVYLYELRDGLDAERIIGSWIDFYNEVRPHLSLRGRTPGEAYREGAEVW